MADARDIAVQLRQWAEGMPRPLRILVQLAEGASRRGHKKEFCAICLQYPVIGHANDPTAATLKALDLLVNYLAQCKVLKAHPIAYAGDTYTEAFELGKPMPKLIDGLREGVKLSVRARESEAQAIEFDVRKADDQLIAV